MNKFKYKELDYAKEILSNGFTSKFIASELKILSKYYFTHGNDESKVKELLKAFCEIHLKNFNLAVHFKIINSAVKFGLNKKNKLIQIDKIEITDKELERINNMDISHEYKRVLFTLMTLTKLSKAFLIIQNGELRSNEFYFGGHKNYRELTKTAKITFNKNKKSNVKNIHDLIHILDEKGIVKITGNGNIKLLFMYDIDDSENAVITVDDYANIGYFYDYHYGENKVKKCENCGRFIKQKSNRQGYCETCWSNHRRLYKTEKQREYRNSFSVDS